MLALITLLLAAGTPEVAPPPLTQQHIANPEWAQWPSTFDLARVHPAAARFQGGWAEIDCTVQSDGHLNDCRAVAQFPADHGFGEAGVDIAGRLYRLTSPAVGSQPTTGRLVRVRFDWPERANVTAGADLIAPDWIRRPGFEAASKAYPPKAEQQGIEGRSMISCHVAGDGRLADCRIVEETPSDYGFGEAALVLVPLFQIRTPAVDGRSLVGETVRVPFTWYSTR